MRYLDQIPLFAGMSEEQFQQIYRHSIERTYAKGTVIFFEGDPGEGFHFVISGQVKIIKAAADGREHTIKIMQPGEVFAEVLLFSNLPYPATAVAADASRIGMIKNSDLEKLVLSNSQLALQLIKSLSQRLLYAQRKIRDLALSDVMSRTVETLIGLAREHGRTDESGRITILLDMPRQELANLAGTTRESVTRSLSALKRDGLIDFDRRRIVILDPKRLNACTK
ncbi:MAG: Crp/Fnr family transcriptional regulator [Sporomusaceae bacterium]|nr:Crp/Fnr family transcriptional regulator [Sporomusaceae bacterium]